MGYKERLDKLQRMNLSKDKANIFKQYFKHSPEVRGKCLRVTESDISVARQVIYSQTNKTWELRLDDILAFFAQRSLIRKSRRNAAQVDVLVNKDDWENLGKIADEDGTTFPHTPATNRMRRKHAARRLVIVEALEDFAKDAVDLDPTHEVQGIKFFDFYKAFQYYCVINSKKHASLEEARQAYEHCRTFAGYPEDFGRLQGVTVRDKFLVG